ncbi:hypothetical protein caldi_14430 [Caldinitratiruptor microaerophilus]|uniref:Uncharacterized protein n=1 Tax=Caldinitratiruptor microaerophilus TaxID=671077 RepID=A0AA35CLL9_9FIRM|nr:hypothetical protein caldi_08770 [Caldinitratiruptor microaerophilus]BDG60353.1 hypothetical protein caldi_14430 [Caldinitratiruptor microaerophilus]
MAEADPELGADPGQVAGGVDRPVVHVDLAGQAVAEDGAFEAVLQAGELLLEIHLAVNDSAMVVEESHEVDLAPLPGLSRHRQRQGVQDVSLPQVVAVLGLKPAEQTPGGFAAQLLAGAACPGQVAAQGGAFETPGCDLSVQLEQGDDLLHTAVGHRPPQGDRRFQDLRGNGPSLVRIRPGVRFEPLEPVLPVGLDPALQRPEPDSGLVTGRDLVRVPGDLPQQALALGRAQVLGQYGGDEAPAEGGDLFPLLLVHGIPPLLASLPPLWPARRASREGQSLWWGV